MSRQSRFSIDSETLRGLAFWLPSTLLVGLFVYGAIAWNLVISLAIGLLIAILVDRNIRFENTFRTIYLLPMSLSLVVTALFWTWMYGYNSGLINELFRFLGLEALAQPWLDDFKLAAVIFALIWQFSAYFMVVYLAGLRAIPICTVLFRPYYTTIDAEIVCWSDTLIETNG